MSAPTIITMIVIIFLFFYVVSIFNKLVSLNNRIQNTFYQIEVQLKHRNDLIPNLVETAKAYLIHDKETIESVVNARNFAIAELKKTTLNPTSSNAILQLAKAEAALNKALSNLYAKAKDYQELKTSKNMTQLTEALTSTENRVAFARQSFNDSVTEYNAFRQSFPALLFSGALGYSQNAELLELEDTYEIQSIPRATL